MQAVTVEELLKTIEAGTQVRVQGWVMNRRISKRVVFMMLQDGSSQSSLQVVVDKTKYEEDFFADITTGTSLAIEGTIVESEGEKQAKELQATHIMLLGKAPVETYPLQPKRHTLEFLRTIQHLRFRTNTFRAIFRIRHEVSHAIHQFFHNKGFYYVHTPVITGLDAEGAGELFGVHVQEKGKENAFFGKPAYLTVSGQLAAEAAALGLGKVYTFGPTFRAENSHTTRHLAEFWMVEPEMAFYDLQACIKVAEGLLKHVFKHVIEHCTEELYFLNKQHLFNTKNKAQESLLKKLANICQAPFMTITYDQAFELLHKASIKTPDQFGYPMRDWGADLQTEHERYLVGYFKKPVVVTHYPKAIKPFYMRRNEDRKTVACMDILFPQIGEIIGGAQREERYNHLLKAMEDKKMDINALDWYLDTRRFGSVVHSGFGLGLERLVQFVTGVENIRDIIPFPRTPGHASF